MLAATVLIAFGAEKEEFSRGHKFVFFAVVEGLYNDGLDESSVVAIIGENMSDNFIVGCPICHPAYDAFLLYRVKPLFQSRKRPTDKFGKGLDVEERKALVGEPNERREQLRDSISKWVEERIKSMNLDEDQAKDLRAELKEMSDRGTEQLESLKNGGNGEFFQKIYADWEFCPSCSGTTLHGVDE